MIEWIRRHSKHLRIALVVFSMAVFMVAMLSGPVQNYLDQRVEVRAQESTLAELKRANEKLSERVERLSTSEEIQRIARRDFGYVQPGEEAYIVLPPRSAGFVLPPVWPFNELVGPLEQYSSSTGE